MESCRLDDVLALIDQPWQPRRVAAVNDHDVKIAKVLGTFIWHSHPNSDELFMVRRTARCARRSSDFVGAGLRPGA